ncbi:hypothetical protein ACOSP7_019554 [Xanthoceras sorbifolium]
MNTFEIVVHFGTNVLELGRCDADHISIITLLHAMNESYTGNSDPPKEYYNVCVQLPWCNERLEVRNDSEIVNVFELFNRHRCGRIVFDVEHKPYIPLPREGSSSINVGSVVEQELETLSWSHLDEFKYEPLEPIGDYDENDLTVSNLAVTEDVELLKLFEGYQPHDNDEYFTDSEDESSEVRISRLVRGKPWQEMVGGVITFEVGQTHDSVYGLRELLREYAIQENVNLDKVKNDKNRLTFKCKGLGVLGGSMHHACKMRLP